MVGCVQTAWWMVDGGVCPNRMVDGGWWGVSKQHGGWWMVGCVHTAWWMVDGGVCPNSIVGGGWWGVSKQHGGWWMVGGVHTAWWMEEGGVGTNSMGDGGWWGMAGVLKYTLGKHGADGTNRTAHDRSRRRRMAEGAGVDGGVESSFQRRRSHFQLPTIQRKDSRHGEQRMHWELRYCHPAAGATIWPFSLSMTSSGHDLET